MKIEILLGLFLSVLASAREIGECGINEYSDGDWCSYFNYKLHKGEDLPRCHCGTTKRIYIHDSNLYNFPREIFEYYTGIERVIMDGQNIQEIRVNSFGMAGKLKNIMLTGNKIKYLKENSFNGAISLEKLWLKENQIEKVWTDAFVGLENLTVLSLNHNEIQSFEETTFDPLRSLEELVLQGNRISFLNEKIFEKNLRLKGIYLNGNHLSTISSKVFSNLVNLDILRLRGNRCISQNWESNAYQHIKTIENELIRCDFDYGQKLENLTQILAISQIENAKKFKELSNKIDEKFRLLSGDVKKQGFRP